MKTKAKSNAKAKAKTKTAPKWSTNGNARSMLRRKALGSLNKLAEEIGATTISAKTAKAKRVEKPLLKSCNAVSLLLQTWSAFAKLHFRGLRMGAA